jgi:enoyl-CoA hydratase/carnithine racemase
MPPYVASTVPWMVPGSEPEPLVTVRRDEAVAVLTLNRPSKLNAISSAMEEALQKALADSDVTSSRCVVVTGGPSFFSAGADVTEMRDLGAEAVFEYYRASGGVYEAVSDLPQPSVSAIAGYCLGGGFELALATDFRIAEETAQLGFPELDIGIVPSSGGILRLVRAVGAARARELVLLRRRVSAGEALAAGLLTEVVPPGQALERALTVARTLAELPALAVTLARRAIDASAESSRGAALLIEQLAYATLVQGRPSQDRIGTFGGSGS